MFEAQVRELLLVRDGVIAVVAEAAVVLSKWSTKLQELHVVIGKVCTLLSPPPPIEVPLVDRLWSLLGHVERVIVEGAFHGNSLALGKMVPHFDEIDAIVTTDDFTTNRSDEELDAIEDQDCPHARSLAERLGVKTLLTGPWSLASPVGDPPASS